MFCWRPALLGRFGVVLAFLELLLIGYAQGNGTTADSVTCEALARAVSLQRCTKAAQLPDQFRQLLYTGAAECVSDAQSALAVSLCTPEYLRTQARTALVHLFDAGASTLLDVHLPNVTATVGSCTGNFSSLATTQQALSITGAYSGTNARESLNASQSLLASSPDAVLTSVAQVFDDLIPASALVELSVLSGLDPDLDTADVLAPLRHKLSSSQFGLQSVLPLDGSVLMVVYRRDVLQAMGLQVPQTWEELVEYVGSYNTSSSRPLWAPPFAFCTTTGTSCDGLPLFEAIWHSIAQSQGLHQGVIFSPATMRPLADSPAFAAAFQLFGDLWRLGLPQPAGQCGCTHPGLRLGECALAVGTLEQAKDVALLSRPGDSNDTGSGPNSSSSSSSSSQAPVNASAFGVSLLPGSTYALDPANDSRLVLCTEELCPYGSAGSSLIGLGGTSAPEWEEQQRRRGRARKLAQATAAVVNRVPYVPSSLLVGGVNIRSSASEQILAWYVLSYFASVNQSLRLVLTHGSNVAPYRTSHFTDDSRARWKSAGYDAQVMNAALDVQLASWNHANLGWGLHMADGAFYRSAVTAFLAKLLGPSASPALPPSSDVVAADVAQLQAELVNHYSASAAGAAQYRAFLGLTGTLQPSPLSPPPPPPAPPASNIGGAGGNPSSHSRSVQLIAAVTIAGVAVLAVLLYALHRGVRDVVWRRPRRSGYTVAPAVSPDTTLLITDIEGSTRLWEELPEEVMGVALRLHHVCIRRVLMRHRGYESATEGDSFILAFRLPSEALAFALEAQQELLEQDWPEELLETQACAPVYTGIPTGFPFKRPAALESVLSRMSMRPHVSAPGTFASLNVGLQQSGNGSRLAALGIGRTSVPHSPRLSGGPSKQHSTGGHKRTSIARGVVASFDKAQNTSLQSKEQNPIMVPFPVSSGGGAAVAVAHSLFLREPVALGFNNAASLRTSPGSGHSRPSGDRPFLATQGSDRREKGSAEELHAVLFGPASAASETPGSAELCPAPSVRRQTPRRPGELTRQLQELQDQQQQPPPPPPPPPPQQQLQTQTQAEQMQPAPQHADMRIIPHVFLPSQQHPQPQQQQVQPLRLGLAAASEKPSHVHGSEGCSSGAWAIIHGGTAGLLEEPGLEQGTATTTGAALKLGLPVSRGGEVSEYASAPSAVVPTASTSRNPTGSGMMIATNDSGGAVHSGPEANDSDALCDSEPKISVGGSRPSLLSGRSRRTTQSRTGGRCGNAAPGESGAPHVQTPGHSRSARAARGGAAGDDGEGVYGTGTTAGGGAWEVCTLEEWLKTTAKSYEEGNLGDRKRRVLWRGLRVRMGLHSGVTSLSELAHNRASARTVYSGDCASIVRAVSDSAHGGMILFSEACLEALLSPGPSSPHGGLHGAAADAILVRIGRYRIRHKDLAMPLYLATAPDLSPRFAMLPPPRNIAPLGLTAYTAPVGRAAAAVMHVPDLPALREWDAEATDEAVAAMEAVVLEQLATHRGYLAAQDWETGSLTATFAFPLDAVRWALTCREQMSSAVQWPQRLLEHELCREGALHNGHLGAIPGVCDSSGLASGQSQAHAVGPSLVSARWTNSGGGGGGAAAAAANAVALLNAGSSVGLGPLPSSASGRGPAPTSLELSHALTASCDNGPAWAAALSGVFASAGGGVAAAAAVAAQAGGTAGGGTEDGSVFGASDTRSGAVSPGSRGGGPSTTAFPRPSGLPMHRIGSDPQYPASITPESTPLAHQRSAGQIFTTATGSVTSATGSAGGGVFVRGGSPSWRAAASRLWINPWGIKAHLRTAHSQSNVHGPVGGVTHPAVSCPGIAAAVVRAADAAHTRTASGPGNKAPSFLGSKVAALSSRLRGTTGSYLDGTAGRGNGHTSAGLLTPTPSATLAAAAEACAASAGPSSGVGGGAVAGDAAGADPAATAADMPSSGGGSPRPRSGLTVKTGLLWTQSEDTEDGGDIFATHLGGMDGFSAFSRPPGVSLSGGHAVFAQPSGSLTLGGQPLFGAERASSPAAAIALRGPRIRVGIDCGVVEWGISASHHCLTYSGSPVSTAEKLAAMATPGQVLATSAVMIHMHRMQASLVAQTEPEDAAAAAAPATAGAAGSGGAEGGERAGEFGATAGAAGGSARGPAVVGAAVHPASGRGHGVAGGRHRRQQVYTCRFTEDWDKAMREHDHLLAVQLASGAIGGGPICWNSPRSGRISPFSSPWTWSNPGRLRSKRGAVACNTPPPTAAALPPDSRRALESRCGFDPYATSTTLNPGAVYLARVGALVAGNGGRGSGPVRGCSGGGGASPYSNPSGCIGYSGHSGPCALISTPQGLAPSVSHSRPMSGALVAPSPTPSRAMLNCRPATATGGDSNGRVFASAGPRTFAVASGGAATSAAQYRPPSQQQPKPIPHLPRQQYNQRSAVVVPVPGSPPAPASHTSSPKTISVSAPSNVLPPEPSADRPSDRQPMRQEGLRGPFVPPSAQVSTSAATSLRSDSAAAAGAAAPAISAGAAAAAAAQMLGLGASMQPVVQSVHMAQLRAPALGAGGRAGRMAGAPSSEASVPGVTGTQVAAATAVLRSESGVTPEESVSLSLRYVPSRASNGMTTTSRKHHGIASLSPLPEPIGETHGSDQVRLPLLAQLAAPPQAAYGLALDSTFASGVVGALTPVAPAVLPVAFGSSGADAALNVASVGSVMAVSPQSGAAYGSSGRINSGGGGRGGGGMVGSGGAGNSSGSGGMLQRALRQHRSYAKRQQQQQLLQQYPFNLLQQHLLQHQLQAQNQQLAGAVQQGPAAGTGAAGGLLAAASSSEEGYGSPAPHPWEDRQGEEGSQEESTVAAQGTPVPPPTRTTWPRAASGARHHVPLPESGCVRATAPNVQDDAVKAPAVVAGKVASLVASGHSAWPSEIAVAAHQGYGGGEVGVEPSGAVVGHERTRALLPASRALAAAAALGCTSTEVQRHSPPRPREAFVLQHGTAAQPPPPPTENPSFGGQVPEPRRSAELSRRSSQEAGWQDGLEPADGSARGCRDTWAEARARIVLAAASKAAAGMTCGCEGSNPCDPCADAAGVLPQRVCGPGLGRQVASCAGTPDVSVRQQGQLRQALVHPHPADSKHAIHAQRPRTAGTASTDVLNDGSAGFAGEFDYRGRQVSHEGLLPSAKTSSGGGWAGDSGGFAARIARGAVPVVPMSPSPQRRATLAGTFGSGDAAVLVPSRRPLVTSASVAGGMATSATVGGSPFGSGGYEGGGAVMGCGGRLWSVQGVPAAATSHHRDGGGEGSLPSPLRSSGAEVEESLDQRTMSDELDDSRATVRPPAGWRPGVHPPPQAAVLVPQTQRRAVVTAAAVAARSFVRADSSSAVYSDGANLVSSPGLAGPGTSNGGSGGGNGGNARVGSGAAVGGGPGRVGNSPRGNFMRVSSSVCTLSLGRLHSASHNLDEPDMWRDESYTGDRSVRNEAGGRQGG